MADPCPEPLTPGERARVHATAWAILGDPHSADDVVQDLALRLGTCADVVQHDRRGAWMARQAIGLSMNRRRGERRRLRREREAGLPRARARVEPADFSIERSEDLEQVRSALAGLEERQRLPIVLRYFHGRRLPEISRILDVPVSTASERLQRGLSAMRGVLRGSEVAPALIGLTLPRAALVATPAVVAGRFSMLLGGSYWAARAAALMAAASLGTHVPVSHVEEAETVLRVASVAPLGVELSDPERPLRPPPISPQPQPLGGGAPPLQPPLEGWEPGPSALPSQPGDPTRVPGDSPVDPASGGPQGGGALGLDSPLGPPLRSGLGLGVAGAVDAPPTGEAKGGGSGDGDFPETGRSTHPHDDGPGYDSIGASGGGPGAGKGGGGSDRGLSASRRLLGAGGPVKGLVLLGGQRPAPGLWVVVFGSGEPEDEEAQREGPPPARPLAVAMTDERGRFQVDVFHPAEELVLEVAALGRSGSLRRLALRSGSDEEGMVLQLGVE